MALIFYLFIFLLGLAVGSFLNCVIFRLEISEGRPKREAFSFLRGRSYCPHCKKELSWQDLVPLFSFIFLSRKCRYCKKPISWQYPMVEIAVGLLFVLIFQLTINNQQLTPLAIISFFYLLTVSCLLVIIFVFDLKHYIIPDGAVYSVIGIALVYDLLRFDLSGRSNILISAFGAAFFFLVIFLISRGKWMGFGDVKLAFFMGLFLGFPKILAALFLAFSIGAIIGVCLIIFGKKKFSSEVPFGPFLIMGTFLALLFGEKLISWYLGFLGSITI